MGTQIDLRDDPQVVDKLNRQRQRPVSVEQGERLAKELGAVKYVECSALTQKGLKNVFDEVRVDPFWPNEDGANFRCPIQAIVAALEPPVLKKKKGSNCVIV